MSSHTKETIKVYPLDPNKLQAWVAKRYPDTLGGNKSIAPPMCEGLIEVPGGYLLVDTDACYSYSTTTMNALRSGYKMSESHSLMFTIEQRDPLPPPHKGWHVKRILRFSVAFDCQYMLLKFIKRKKNEMVSRSLADFCGSRGETNPRIVTNIRDLLKEINFLHSTKVPANSE